MGGDLLLREFCPRPRAVLRETAIPRPRFPVIDAHNRFARQFAAQS